MNTRLQQSGELLDQAGVVTNVVAVRDHADEQVEVGAPRMGDFARTGNLGVAILTDRA